MGSHEKIGVARDAITAWTHFTGLPISITILLLPITCGVVYSICRALISPLKAVPGPFLARFTDLWYLWRLYQGQFEEENLLLHEKYGRVMEPKITGKILTHL